MSVGPHRRTRRTICSGTDYGKDPLTLPGLLLSGVSCNRDRLLHAGICHGRAGRREEHVRRDHGQKFELWRQTDEGFKKLLLEYVNQEAKDGAQMVKSFPSMHQALGLTPTTA